MAVLRHPVADTERRTPPRAIIGRGPRCDLRVDDAMCSTQHAEILWTGDRWVIRDLDSRNGTWLDGRRLQPSEVRELGIGQRVAFGNPPLAWRVQDLPDPVACARSPVGELFFAQQGTLVIPASDRPEVVVDFDGDGRWWMEQGEARSPCPAEAEVWIDGQPWHLMAPQPEPGTQELSLRQSLSSARLTFHVSPDEEQVIVDALSLGMLTRLEPRAHGYLLLYLAERRLEDRARGVPPRLAGWRRLDDQVAEPLGMLVQDVNVQVYRARRQLKESQIEGAARLVERRAGELRIGVEDLQVTRYRDWPPPDLRTFVDESSPDTH